MSISQCACSKAHDASLKIPSWERDALAKGVVETAIPVAAPAEIRLLDLLLRKPLAEKVTAERVSPRRIAQLPPVGNLPPKTPGLEVSPGLSRVGRIHQGLVPEQGGLGIRLEQPGLEPSCCLLAGPHLLVAKFEG